MGDEEERAEEEGEEEEGEDRLFLRRSSDSELFRFPPPPVSSSSPPPAPSSQGIHSFPSRAATTEASPTLGANTGLPARSSKSRHPRLHESADRRALILGLFRPLDGAVGEGEAGEGAPPPPPSATAATTSGAAKRSCPRAGCTLAPSAAQPAAETSFQRPLTTLLLPSLPFPPPPFPPQEDRGGGGDENQANLLGSSSLCTTPASCRAATTSIRHAAV